MRATNDIRLSAQQAASIREALAEFEDDELTLDTIEGETSLFECLDALLESSQQDADLASAIGERMKVMQDRKKRIEDREKRKRKIMTDALEIAGVKTVERPLGTLTLANVAPAADVYAPEALPSDMLEIEIRKKPKRAEIKNALQEGKDVPGARLTNGGVSLRVRT